MNIQNIEKKEKNMATFEVKVPADVFDNAVNEAYKKNKNHLYVAGFRKGKAPRAVIEGMYGKEVFYPDAIEALAEDAFEAGRHDAGRKRRYGIARQARKYPRAQIEHCELLREYRHADALRLSGGDCALYRH